MPTTFEALAIAVAFLAPGLLYELGVTFASGYQRPESLQKIWRAFSYSLVLQALLLPFTTLAWRRYGDVDLRVVPLVSVWPLFALATGYVFGPLVVGLLVGRRQRARRAAVPSAWDHLFGEGDHAGYVRARLKDGSWVGGIFGVVQDGVTVAPFATGYPDHPSLFLPVQLALDPETGGLLLDDGGRPAVRDWSLLLDGADIDLLEFQEISLDEESRHG